jgi:hypothetical protein
MKMFKLFIGFVVASAASVSFAGGSSGTMREASLQVNPMVWLVSQNNQAVQFGLAQWTENKWTVQKLQASPSEISADPSLELALEASLTNKTWVQLIK